VCLGYTVPDPGQGLHRTPPSYLAPSPRTTITRADSHQLLSVFRFHCSPFRVLASPSRRRGRLFFASLPPGPICQTATHLCTKKGAPRYSTGRGRADSRASPGAEHLHQQQKHHHHQNRAHKSARPGRGRKQRAACSPVLPAAAATLSVPIPAPGQALAKCGSRPLRSWALSLSLRVLAPGRVRSASTYGPRRRSCAGDNMSSAAGGGYGAGGAEHQHLLLGQAAGAGQLYHVPQHSRREKLRFPPDDAADSPPPTAWPAPPPFYSYASSSTSSYYSPHSPTLAHAQLVAHALPAGAGVQIPSQNFALSLSSAPSNPPPAPRRQLAAGVATGPYGPFTGYAAVLGRSRFLGPAQKLLEEICNVGGRPPHLDPLSDEGMFGMEHGMGGVDRATAEAVAVSGAEQQWRKTRLISLMEDVSFLILH
jgi:hypothetical protein